MLRIIDNKRIDLTNDEYEMYNNICKSHTRENFDGKELFVDLFETDDDGIIIMLKPPSRMFSMQVVLFLQNVMIHQHLRRIYAEHNSAMEELKKGLEQIKSVSSEQPE